MKAPDNKLATWSLTVAIIGLACSILYTAVRIGTIYGMVNAEHKQLMDQNQQVIEILKRCQ